MLRAIVSKSIAGVRCRSISFAAKNFDKVSESTTGQGKLKSNLSSFEQKVLVWTKKYKSIEDIPERVGLETLNQCKSRFRVKVCNYMILATIVGCIAMVISGKKAAARGESVVQSNEEWHRKYNEEANAKEAKEAKALAQAETK